MPDVARWPRRGCAPARASRPRRIGGRHPTAFRRDALSALRVPKPELTERELDFLVDVDRHSREAILAVDPSTGHGVGVVRYVEVPGEPGVVEIAATVADDWQGRGLGRALLEQLTSRARDEGYSTLRANVLAANRRSINMLGRLRTTRG